MLYDGISKLFESMNNDGAIGWMYNPEFWINLGLEVSIYKG